MGRYYLDDIEDLAARFQWVHDGKIDSFRILDAPEGPLVGDCDDFAVTALWIAEGRLMRRFWWALLSRRAVLWYVAGEGFASHVVLHHKIHGWIDNQNPTWGEKRHTRRFPAPVLWVMAKMLLGKAA
jgi:hypothetical protein